MFQNCFLQFCCIFSLEKDDTEVMSTEVMSTEVMSTPPSSTNPFETKSDEEDGEEEYSVPDQAEDDEEFVVADMTDRLTLLKQRSRQGIAIDEDEAEAFELQPLRADEALRTRE